MEAITLIFIMFCAWLCAYFFSRVFPKKADSSTKKAQSINSTSDYIDVILPDMFQSFLRHPPKLNPHYEAVKPESENWLSQFCSYGPEMKKRIEICSFSYFCAISAPFAPRTEFRTLCDWGNWVFAYDDMFDEGHLKDRPVEASKVMDSLMALMDEKKYDGSKMKIVEVHDTVVQRMATKCSLGLQKRFASGMRAYCLGALKQVRSIEGKEVPTLEEMVLTRRESAGVTPVFNLVEYAHDLKIPDEVFEDPNMKELETLGTDLVSIANDILSYKKEEADGVPHNMVAACRRHGMSAQEAFDAVGTLLSQRFQRWEVVEKNVPSWGEKVDIDIRRYIEGIKSVVKANTNWGFDTKRYWGPNGPEVRRTRKIQVLARPPYMCNKENV